MPESQVKTCKNGHPMVPSNTFYRESGQRRPGCKECKRSTSRAYAARQKQGVAFTRPTDSERRADALRRLLAAYEEDAQSGCWIWQRSRTPGGYGKIQFDGRLQVAHRVSYTLLVGEVPEGLELDHLCRNRACINPQHLEPVTRLENQLRGETFVADHARRTHCPRGHELSGENLSRYSLKKGRRRCATCHRETERTRRAK